MIGTLDYAKNDRSIYVYLKFYDKNGVVVKDLLLISDKLAVGESGYIYDWIYLSSINGAVSAKFVVFTRP